MEPNPLRNMRRDLLKFAGLGVAGTAAGVLPSALGQMSGQAGAAASTGQPAGVLDVRSFGAGGAGHSLDTPAINRAIETAAERGGGTVYFGAGQYLCHSIHLKSNVGLYLDHGAVIIAADPLPEGQPGGYDSPGPPQPWEAYQDFGHNHWRNSLIWGEDLHDISISGPGRIWGRGLVRSNDPRSRRPAEQRVEGVGNKSISLKNCRNVQLRDFQILQGGWFGILATGVDNLLIDGLTIDTNRDGMDIDCCRNVRIVNCAVNSPWDDGIVPKSSYALGYLRPTENMEISNCYVTGAYQLGTVIDGTWKRFDASAPKRAPQVGRIKLGTESNGGFKNIAIANCVFEGGWGFALETVDGALLEEITFTGITMRDIVNTPILLRLGSRLRGPKGTKVGQLRRVILSNIVSYNSASEFGGGGIIAGIPGHSIADIKVNDCYFQHRAEAGIESTGRVPPENASAYPDPSMFGALPASGFFVRHVNNIEFTNVEIACADRDPRPAFWLGDVDGADFFFVKAPKAAAGNTISMHDVRDLRTVATRNVADLQEERIDSKVL